MSHPIDLDAARTCELCDSPATVAVAFTGPDGQRTLGHYCDDCAQTPPEDKAQARAEANKPEYPL